MEGLESFHAYLKNAQHQAGILAEAVVSLSQSFELEAERLTREDQAQHLKAIHTTIVEKLEWSRQMESAARYGNTKARVAWSLAGLAANLITRATTENRQTQEFVDHLFDTSQLAERPYGTVMVCVGPKGMPDDVHVVSISELARESKQPELKVIQKLREHGCLLISQEAFVHLIDRLITDIREGRLYLPVMGNKLSEMVAPTYLRLETKRLE
jgi:hypothetical protein